MDINEMSAWGIQQAIAQIIENGFTYDEETGEVFFTSDDLDALGEALETKMNSLCGYIKYAESRAKAFKNRKEELEENQKYYEKRAESLKNYVNNLMQASGKTSLDTNDFRVSMRKSTASDVYDEVALRNFIESSDENKEKYYTYKTPDIAKKALADAIKETKKEDGTYSMIIPGFKLVENKNVQIK